MAALNVEISTELKKTLDHAVTDRDTTLKAAVSEAISTWVSGDSKSDPHTLAAALGAEANRQKAIKHQQWHTLLDQILDGGSEADIVGIQQNLKWAAEAVARQGPPPRRRAG